MLHIQRAFTSNEADKGQFVTTTNQFGTPAQPNVQENLGVNRSGSNCLDTPKNSESALICQCRGKKCVQTLTMT